MLNKEVCRRCCTRHRENWRWEHVRRPDSRYIEEFDAVWSEGVIVCPWAVGGEKWMLPDAGLARSTVEPPPPFCPYETEHVVSEDAD